jgi:serine/threonine-protein kinase HipA
MFNFLIGNNDAHAKNHSLLLDGPEAVRLAPLYDLICTEVFDGTRKKLAMKYGGENKPLYLRRRHLDRLAESLNAAPRLVTRRAPGLIAAVSEAREPARRALPEAFAEQPLLDDVEALIAARCERLAKIVAEPA